MPASVPAAAAAAAAVAASASQSPSCDRLPSRLYAVMPVCRGRLKLFSSFDFPASGAQSCWLLHLMPVRRKLLWHVTTQTWRLRAFVSSDAYEAGISNIKGLGSRSRERRQHKFDLSGEADGDPRGKMPGKFSFEKVLAVLETLCVIPSVVLAIVYVVGLAHPGMSRLLQAGPGNVFFVWQFILLVVAVALGATIRRRQWHRFCMDDGVSLSMIDRIGKVEEDIRSSVTMVRMLSRQLEKLGIKFRVTRKALKEPIIETASLAQRNSEATRTLALQEDILEKEIGEIQKVLLAMQEQQQKQLELILAIGKAGKLIVDGKLEEKKETVVQGATRKSDSSSLARQEHTEPRTANHLLSNNDHT